MKIIKIKKIYHNCIIIDINGVKILTDPGVLSSRQDIEKNIDIVLISHKHQDHFNPESVKNIVKNNPEAVVLTNKQVGDELIKIGVGFTEIYGGKYFVIKGVPIEGVGSEHANIYKSVPKVENTGFFIADMIFYPGDSFTNPGKQVEVLALPISAPWLKLSEALDYALEIRPKNVFQVHDGFLKGDIKNTSIYNLPKEQLSEIGTNFVWLDELDTVEF